MSPGYEPKNPAAAKHLKLQSDAFALINRADRRLYKRRPWCRPRFIPPTSTTTTDAPQPATLNLIAALRRPATPEDVLPTGLGEVPGLGEVYADYTRSATAANGQRFSIIVSRIRVGDTYRTPSASCRDAEATAINHTKHTPAAVRSAALRIQRQIRRGEARAKPPRREPQDILFFFILDDLGYANGGGGGGESRYLATHGGFVSIGGRGKGSTLNGLLPDGVATVELVFPKVVSRGRYYKPTIYPRTLRRTVRVQQNVVSLRVSRPPEDAFPRRMVWRSASGAVVRRIGFPR